MASPTSLQFPVTPPFPTPSKPTPPYISLHFKPPRVSHHSPLHPKLKPLTKTTKRLSFIFKAIEESRESTESETISTQENPSDESQSASRPTESSAEIKKAMKEREGSFWSGVAEEIREIEWPAFGKVLGTTGVVLGVIAGSSVVLLTVNAVLAELSDRVFAGRGVQDFFG